MSDSFKFTFVNNLVDDFYKFMADMYIEYKLTNNKQNKQNKQNSDNDNDDNDDGENIISNEIQESEPVSDKPVSNIKKPILNKTFSDYFLFKLYYNYGIKRTMVNDYIALLYYSKQAKGYKSNENITMLCRHMLLDTKIMRIISLGIQKCVKFDTFCNIYNIDKTNASTNFVDDGEIKKPKYRIYKFPEGTMMTYNPSLKKYNITTTTSHDIDNEEPENITDSTKEMEVINNMNTKFTQQFQFSTRKVIGTGRFSSLKTFLEMFEENNKIANINLDNIPEDIMKDKVLVFNIEHTENRMISSDIRNYNTLCAVFQFKQESIAEEQYNKITSITLEPAADNTVNIECIKKAFIELGKDMVTQINVTVFKKTVQEYGVNFHMPEVIKSFEKRTANGVIETIVTDTLSLEQIQFIVANKPKGFQGYIIYGNNGERTKITNEKYKMLKELKGNKPIVIDQWNTKNLFYLYWRLIREKKIEQFIAEFDNNNGWTYMQLFTWFSNLARMFSNNLFKIYHNSFVKKTMNKPDIPYTMKPLCGDLHNGYKANKVPVSNTMVEQYIFEQPASKIFWRLFTN
jgi:hypothetical protein